jgi:hypothetical protein
MNMQVRLNAMDVMDYTGHTTVTWDPNNEASTADARAQFNRLRASGHSIFRMAAIGATAVVEEADQSQPVDDFNPADGRLAAIRIDEFDPQAERLTAIPQRVGG